MKRKLKNIQPNVDGKGWARLKKAKKKKKIRKRKAERMKR